MLLLRRPASLLVTLMLALACQRDPAQPAEGGGEGGGSTGNFDAQLEEACRPWCMHNLDCNPGATDVEMCTASCVEVESHYGQNSQECRDAVIAFYDCLTTVECGGGSMCQGQSTTVHDLCGN